MTTPAEIARTDQLQAAQTQLNRLLSDLPDDKGLKVPAGPWLTNLIHDTVNALQTHHEACEHLTGPQPFITATWANGEIWCLPCEYIKTAEPAPTGPCDRCGEHPSTDDVHLATTQILMIRFRLCAPCEELAKTHK